MRKQNMLMIRWSFMMLFLAVSGLKAQEVSIDEKMLTFSSESQFSIQGTSTLHEWVVKTSDVTGNILLPPEFLSEAGPAAGTMIDSVIIKVPVQKMDGGRGQVMNDKIVKALSGTTHPHVIYTLNEAKVIDNPEAASDEISIEADGKLNIGGVIRDMKLILAGQKSESNDWIFEGSKQMKMSDFEIEPPSAMFGQIVTGDEITINYSLIAVEMEGAESAKSN